MKYQPFPPYIHLLILKHKPITRRQILDPSKLKEFADDNFKFDEIGRKLSKQVENTAGKGEIARYEQFLLFPQCFQKACFPNSQRRQKVSLCGNEQSHLSPQFFLCNLYLKILKKPHFSCHMQLL